MSNYVGTFCGWWEIRFVAGDDPAWKAGALLEIGTGENGATAPFLDEETVACVGFAIYEALEDETYVKVLNSDDDEQYLKLIDGSLRWDGTWVDRRLRIYISLSTAWTEGGLRSDALYGTTILGDPDQVGVWGAEAHPPPPGPDDRRGG